MITLKNGVSIPYNRDFDDFFKNLLETVIEESRKTVDQNSSTEDSIESLNEAFLKELMDNCIFVTHQIFNLPEEFGDLSQFMVSGFIFNSLLLLIQNNRLVEENQKDSSDEETIH